MNSFTTWKTNAVPGKLYELRHAKPFVSDYVWLKGILENNKYRQEKKLVEKAETTLQLLKNDYIEARKFLEQEESKFN